MDIENIRARADELFAQGYNCAQAAFAAWAPEFGVGEAAALRAAASFGAGIGRRGDLCGAVSGALMAIGLKRAPAETSPEIKSAAYARARTLMAAFAERCGATDCRDLTGCDLSTPEGAAKFKAENLGRVLCPRLVRTAVDLVSEA